MWGFNNTGSRDKVKKHLENEYARSQELNKVAQERLDTKRKYREQMGKKKVDTIFMKWEQESINEVSKQTQADFNKKYVEDLVNNATNSAYNDSYNNSYYNDSYYTNYDYKYRY
jgi:hypothetical protein